MRRFVAVVVAGLLLGTSTACGDDEEPPVRPLLDQIEPAMTAVDAEMGGAQQYFEVNATPLGVNLFVAIEGATQSVAYIFVGGELGSPGAAEPSTGGTFTAADVAFDPATILDGVTEDLPDSNIARFAIAGNSNGDVQFTVDVQSEAGGTLQVTLAEDGSVVSVDPGS
ncbi:MAG: hypothetical protein ABW219_12965 [Ilumatobacteraceae bacterium]